MISPAQIRAGRAMINAKQSELAKVAGVSLATLNNIERGVGDPRASTLESIRNALSGAGVELEDDGTTQSVRLLSLSRPSAYETYFASQRILELIGPGSLLKVDRLLFFARWDHAAAEGEDRHRLCLLIEGATRAVLFDQVNFSLGGGARAAEVAGILLAAYTLHADRLYYLADVMEDTTLAPLEETVRRLRGLAWLPMRHPAPLIDVFDDWHALVSTYGRRHGHPVAALAARLGDGSDSAGEDAAMQADVDQAASVPETPAAQDASVAQDALGAEEPAPADPAPTDALIETEDLAAEDDVAADTDGEGDSERPGTPEAPGEAALDTPAEPDMAIERETAAEPSDTSDMADDGGLEGDDRDPAPGADATEEPADDRSADDPDAPRGV